MIPPVPLKKDEPVSLRPGKKAVTAAVILVVLVILVVAVVVLLQSPSGSSTAPLPEAVKNPGKPASDHTVRQVTVKAPVKPVDFVIQAGEQVNCGLTCRQLTPSITNAGYETAHNVCISITLVNSGGDLILLNGESSINKCIGTIASGESKSEPIVINADCGFLASKCVKQTLILKTKATCDEATVQFPDRIIAV